MADHFDPYHVWLGIPPEEQPPNHYRLLGLRSLESDSEVISNALDQRLAFLRTFQAGKRGALSQKLLNEVSAAGVVLLNPQKKEHYDAALSAPPNAGQPSASAPVAASPPIVAPPQFASPAAASPPGPLPMALPITPHIAPPALRPQPTNTLPTTAQPTAARTTAAAETGAIPALVTSPVRARAAQAASTADKPGETSLNPHLLPLLAAAVGLVGLAVLVGGGWWLLGSLGGGGTPRPPVVQNDKTGSGKSDNKITGGAIDSPIGSPGSSTNGGQSIAGGQRPGATPVAAATAADRQIWQADQPAKRVIRRVGNRWIDFREQSEFWLEEGPVGRDSVTLSDPARRLTLELFDDRLEAKHATASAAVAAVGRWISSGELPAFARRSPAGAPPDPLRRQPATWHALVLDGNSTISFPTPPELLRPGADFTIEMWVRFDARHPESRLVMAHPLQLHTLRPRLEIGSAPSMLMADLKSGPLGIAVRPTVLGDRWHHWAIVRAGRQMRLFVDGQPRATLPLDDSYAILSPMIYIGGPGEAPEGSAPARVKASRTRAGFAAAGQDPHLRGMIRELHISSVARYKQVFRPPLRLAKDDQTLLLPKFEAAAEDRLEDLSGRGHHGSRGTAQWLPLSADEGLVQAELAADFVDLERAFSAHVHTLRGTTEGNANYHDTTTGRGICQMLIPYQPQGDYDLVLEVERLEGNGGLLLGLVLGPQNKQLALAVNAFADRGGPLTGILPDDLATVAPQPTLVRHEPLFATGKREQMLVEVRHPSSNRYAIRVAAGGTTLASISDIFSSDALSPELSLPQKAALFWGSQDAKIRLHSFKLYPAGRAPSQGMVASAGSLSPAGNGGTPAAAVTPTSAAATSGPPSAKAALAGKAWLADGQEQRAIRLVNGRWVELRERDEHWYGLREASPSEYVLFDAARKVELRLRDAEVAVRTPAHEWASLGPGRWVDAAQLPAFAQRPLGSAASDPTSFREPNWHALVFDGRAALRMSLPSEIGPENRDFTIEAWLRFDSWQPDSMMRLMSVGSLLMFVAPGPGVPGEARELHLTVERTVRRVPFAARAERWHHLAVVRQGGELRLYLDGQQLTRFGVSARFTLDGPTQSVVFGQNGGSTTGGFQGALRDFRLSKVARYAGSFTPPLRSTTDSETLVLPKFLADPQPLIENLAPTASRITRDKAQWATLNHWGEWAGWRPDGALDLTRLYSVANHSLVGKFYRTSEYTDSLASDGPALVLVPHRPGANYDIELEATRLEGQGGVLLGLLIGDKQAVLGLDIPGQQGRRTGILPAVLSQLAAKSDLVSHNALLTAGGRHQFVVKVRQPASDRYAIEVSHNRNNRYATLEGPLAELAVPSELTSRLATTLSVGSLDARIRLHTLLLKPGPPAPPSLVRGPPPGVSIPPGALPPGALPPGVLPPGVFPPGVFPPGVLPPGVLPPGVPPPRPQGPAPSSVASTSPAPAAKRRAVPSPEELARGLADARKAFEGEFQSATKPAQKAVLARHILTAANNTRSDAIARYVLVDLARKVFVQAGEVNESLDAARTLEREFELAQDQLVIETLEALDDTTLPPEERTLMARVAIDLAEEWLADDDYDLAEKLATIASQSAGKQKDAELRKDVFQRRGQLMRIVAAARAAEPSLKVLATQPNDPAANLAVGKFRCLVREDWADGLPQLAKSGDANLAAAAKLDLATSSGKASDLVAAGEAWLKLAADTKATSRDDRPALERRAREHLTAAMPGLTGLEALRIQRRLEEIKDVAPAAPKRPSRTRAPRTAGSSGLIGRAFVRGQDAGIVVNYQPGYTVTQEDVQALVAATGATPADAIRIDLVGVLTLTADAQVEMKHVGGSTSGGVHTLVINGQTISEIGDDRSKDDTRQLPLVRGQHAIRWTLTGGDLGTARLSLVPVDSAGQPQPGVATIHFTRDMNVLAHGAQYKHEFRWAEE